MGDVAKGIKAFKKGMSEDEDGARSEKSLDAPQLDRRAIDAEKTIDHHKL